MRYIVLGGYGIIGRVVVEDLAGFAKNSEIIVAGRDERKAKEIANKYGIKSKGIDITNKEELVILLKGADVCVNCLQYYFNLDVMKACIKAKVHYVDLGGMFHMTKKQLLLNRDFCNIGRTAILGIGSTPGITNVLTMYGSRFLDKVESVEITFADKDETKYKQRFILPYSFKTLIDEYTMKPAVLKNGKLTFAAPRSGEKQYYFNDEFGEQYGFYTLHSELATLPDSLKEKEIKNCEFRVTFPREFSEIIESLIELGFSSRDEIDINEKKLEILDISTAIMDKLIPKGVEVRDKELLRVILRENGKEVAMDAITESNGKMPAGVLDTGIPCSIAAQMLASGEVKISGVLAPENALDAELFFKELARKKIKVLKNGRQIN